MGKGKVKSKSNFSWSKIVYYSVTLIVVLLSFAVLFYFNIQGITGLAVYQPTGAQGSPTSDSNPRFNGTDQTANYNGSGITVSKTDGDSTALEQNLTQENITITIVSSDFDPGSILQGNYTLGTTTGSEAGIRFNGSSNGTEAVGGATPETVSIIAELDRNEYYDLNSSISARIYVRGTLDSVTTDISYRSSYFIIQNNNTKISGAFTACNTHELTVTNTWEPVSPQPAAQTLNTAFSPFAQDDNVTHYGVEVQVDTDGLCLDTENWGGRGNATTLAKNKTIEHRWKWVYSVDDGTSWIDGTNFTAFNATLLRFGTKTIAVPTHIAEGRGDIERYGLLVEINGTDDHYNLNSDVFNATSNGTQSNLNLTQTAFATVGSTYFPSNNTINTTLWFRGELGYAYGADPNDFNGTGEAVNVTLWKPTPSGWVLNETKFPTLNENGSFNVNFTLLVEAQAGQWLLKTNYNHSDDVFPEKQNIFTVRIIANGTKTYGFYGENVSAGFNPANTTNLNGAIRIETIFFNNPEDFSMNCNTTIQNKDVVEQMVWDTAINKCAVNTTAPISIGVKYIQTNFSVNGSTGATEDSFSSENAQINVSDVLITNGTDAEFNVYNFGETAQHWGYVYNVRGEPLQGKKINISLIDSSNRIQNTNTSVFTDGAGFFNKTISTNQSNTSTHTLTGEQYKTYAQWNGSFGNSSETTISVSSLYFVSSNSSAYDNDVGINVTPTVYNLGEVVGGNVTVFGVRNQSITFADIVILFLNNSNYVKNTNNSRTNGNGFAVFSVFLGPQNTSNASLLGSPYHINLSHNGNWVETVLDFNVSSLLRVGSQNSLINNITSTLFSVFNRGQNVTVNFSLFNVRGSPYASLATVRVLDNNSQNENEVHVASFDSGTTKYNFTYEVAAGDTANDAFAGSNKRLNFNFSDGNVNITSAGSWNVSSLYLLNVHCEIDSSRATVYSNTTFPNTNETSQAATAIIAADVLYCWNELRDAKNESVNGVSTAFNLLRPDGTSAATENQTTGSDGWTTTAFDKATEAPSGTWSIQGNVSHFNNTGNETDTISFISPYTGNLGKICFVRPQNGADVPSIQWNFNDNVTVRCEFRQVNNFVDTRVDADSNDTRLDIEKLARNGSQILLFDDVSMTRVLLGKYDYNITLNASNGFEEGFVYNLLGNAKIDSRDVLADGHFYIVNTSSTTFIEISVDPRPTAGENVEAKIFTYDNTGSLVNVSSMDIAVFDANGNKNLGPVSFDTQLSKGKYQFNFTSPSTPEGLWEIEVNATRGGKMISGQQYFLVVGGPFDVRNIQVLDSTVPSLTVTVDLENTGNVKQDIVVNWVLTRTDTGATIDSGQDTVAVNGGEVKTHTVSPSTTFTGNVKITFTGFYGVDFGEQAAAFKTFTTTAEAAGAVTGAAAAGGGGGGGGGARKAVNITEEEIPEIKIEEREGKIELIGYPLGLSIIKSEKTQQKFKVRNVGNGDLTNVRMLLSGLPLELISIDPKYFSVIYPEEVVEFRIDFDSDISVGTFDIQLIVLSDQGGLNIDGVMVIKEPKGAKKEIQSLLVKETKFKGALQQLQKIPSWVLLVLLLATSSVFLIYWLWARRHRIVIRKG